MIAAEVDKTPPAAEKSIRKTYGRKRSKTMSFVVVVRWIASRWPSRDQAKPVITPADASVKCVIGCAGPPSSGWPQMFIPAAST